MAQSTAPILLTGGVTFANEWLGNGTLKLDILVATGIAAAGFALVEQIPGMAPVAGAIAWVAFVTMMITPPGGGRSPVQNLAKLTGV